MSYEGECPVCAARRNFPTDTMAGELVSCLECGTQLEVKELSPFQLTEAPLEGEDWGE